MIQVTDYASRFTRYGYDRAGRLLTTRLPNGITTTYRYDGAGRLTNLTHAGRWWTLAAYTYTLDAVGNRIAVEERVLAPNPPVYLPLVMRNYGGGGGQGMSAPAAGPQVAPFVSPLPVPAPEPQPFDSPLETPVEDSSSRVPAPFRARLLLPDFSLLLFAPLVVVNLAQRKRRRWAWPLAAVLLIVAVVAIGMGLAGGSVAPAAALPAPLPFLSPQSPPPYPGCTYPTAIAGSRVISYTYDPLYRLTGAAYSSGECYQYGYDRAGNRTVYTVTLGLTTVTTYTYDAVNYLRVSVSLGHPITYTWDNRGNLTSNGVFTYTYNAAGQMVRAQSITATLVYTYNGDGLLVSKSSGGQTTRYTWDLASGLPQMLGDGSALYVPGVGEWSAAQGWVYYLADGLGSVRQLADARGYVVQRYAYGPFGEPQAAEGTRASRMRYTREQWDGDVGLVYLRARWYDPATGRFTTPDPFPGFATLPQTQHPYIYVGNNPVNLTDPGGEIAPILIAAGAGAVIGAVGGGVSYVLAHPGGRPEEYLRSGGFWQAVGIGAASGAVAGAVGWLVPTLLPAASSFWGAVGIGALTGSLASGAGQITANLLNPCVGPERWYEGVPETMVTGGIIGGVAGGAGWWIRRWVASQTPVSWPARPHGTADHWAAIQQEVERMAASGQYSDISVNSSLSTATNGQVQSGLRPDIVARTPSGKYVIVEVMSPSQTYAQLEAKVQSIAQLLGPLFGGGRVIQP